jgi:hypothetical protein
MQKVWSSMVVVCWVLIAGCMSPVDEAAVSSQLVHAQTFRGDAADACFAKQMDVWLDRFSQYQHNGVDMFTADIKARDAAIKAYQDCHNRRADALATDEARKD